MDGAARGEGPAGRKGAERWAGPVTGGVHRAGALWAGLIVWAGSSGGARVRGTPRRVCVVGGA